MRIPLMNLSRQFATIETDVKDKVFEVLKSGQYIMGPNVKAFEQEYADYIGAKYAIGVANGTEALDIALKAVGVQPGDEVITCAMSFFSTAEAISTVGAVPVFVDCTADTYTIDADQIEAKITAKTKAIIVIHLYGQCADMQKVRAIADKHGLKVVEDAAQASGAEYQGVKAGALGDVACFSFFPTKNLGCAGDGGIITTNSEEAAKICRAYRVHGSGMDGKFAAAKLAGKADNGEEIDFGGNLPKYFNFVIGYNSRLDEIQASILRVKLPLLDGWNEQRSKLAAEYDAKINNPKVKKPVKAAYGKHIYYVYVVMTEDREALRQELNAADIACGVYFPVPLHLQEVYKNLGYKKGDMPNAEYLAEHSLAIPMFAELTAAEQQEVIDIVNKH